MIDIIFLDMDGVISDWNAGTLRVCGSSWEEVKKTWPPSRGFTLHEPLGLTEAELEAKIDADGEEFWTNLPKFPWARSLYYTCQDIAPTCILTNPHSTFKGAVGKLRWLQNLFGPDFKDVLMGKAKEFCAGPGRVLIDDKESNCEAFEKAGGKAILFPQYWNKRHEEWPNAPKLVVEELQKLAKGGPDG